jgi:hypothetical protein
MPGSLLARSVRPSPSRLLAPGLVLSASAVSFAAGVLAATALVAGRPPAAPAACPVPVSETAPAPPAPAVQWASTVIARSSEYGAGDWSAARVLGPPDVWPASGDQVNAWASRGADDAIEYLHVGFDQPRRLSGLEIFETYNPGAITKVELITADGGLWTVYDTEAAAQGTPTHHRKLTFACTDLPVASVKLTIDSPAVPGWNEIDAIGAVGCVVPSPAGG